MQMPMAVLHLVSTVVQIGTSIYAQQLAGSMCLSGSAEVAAARGQDADG